MSKQSLIPTTKATGDSEVIINNLISWANNKTASQHCTVTGGPGAGKTYLIRALLEKIDLHLSLNLGLLKEYNIFVTSTTNKSLENLPPHEFTFDRTIYSILQLVPDKGVIKLRKGKHLVDASYNPSLVEKSPLNSLIICDESNYISQETLEIISKWFPYVRIIFIGSEHQLGSESGISKIFDQGWDNFYLDTSFRADNPDVQAVYDNSENDVINQTVNYINNPSIVYLNEKDWLDLMNQFATSDKDFITVAYTNKRVYELVGKIRQMKGKQGFYDLLSDTQVLRAGSPLIPKYNPPIDTLAIGTKCIRVTAPGSNAVLRSPVAESYEHFLSLQKTYKRGDKFIYPSLVSSTEAQTIHTAQGGTWDYTFFDLPNLSYPKFKDPETFRRLKHVAESRHRKKLFVRVKE